MATMPMIVMRNRSKKPNADLLFFFFIEIMALMTLCEWIYWDLLVNSTHLPQIFLSLLVAVPVHIGTHTYSHRYKIFNAFDFLTNFDPLSYLKEIKIMKKINIYLNYIIK
jgi:hypothetical protein